MNTARAHALVAVIIVYFRDSFHDMRVDNNINNCSLI